MKTNAMSVTDPSTVGLLASAVLAQFPQEQPVSYRAGEEDAPVEGDEDAVDDEFDDDELDEEDDDDEDDDELDDEDEGALQASTDIHETYVKDVDQAWDQALAEIH